MSETGEVFHVKQREGESVSGGSFVLEKMGVVESVEYGICDDGGLLVLGLDE